MAGLAFEQAWAVPPANDLCSGAVVIPSAGPFPYLTAVVTNITEATTTGDPALSCQPTKSRSVWFKFSPTTSGLYTFSTAGDTATTVPDTVLGLYQGNNCSSLTERYCADDVGSDLRAAFTTNLSANATYFIVAWIFDVEAPAYLQDSIQLRVSKPTIPTNDLCSAAQVIPSFGPFPYFTPISDTTLATTNSDPPALQCPGEFFRSTWYKFVPSNTVTYIFSTCLDTVTTLNDTVMGVYGSANGCGGPLVPITCNDDGCDMRRSRISTTLTNGQTYYVVVWEYGTAAALPGQTSLQLKVSVPAPVFTSNKKLSNGSYQMVFTGFPNQTYTVEASTNLLDWVPIGTPTHLGGGNYQFTVTNATTPTYRFFRTRTP